MKNTTIALASIASALLISSGLANADDRRSNRAMMFDKADSNNDGKLSRDELIARATAHFTAADKDGNGEISAAEMADTIQRRRDERRAQRVLKRMDYNGDGKVTKDEAESRAGKRFALMDSNDDGFVEKSELKRQRLGGRKHRRTEHRQGERHKNWRKRRNGDDL